MEAGWRRILDQQFGAAMDMLEHAMAACPDDLWARPAPSPAFWYLVFHTLEIADIYLGRVGAEPRALEPFSPPDEATEASVPVRPYGKDDLARYLSHVRAKGADAVARLPAERRRAESPFRPGEPSVLEAVVYATRHSQHHIGQLYLLLRQETGAAPGWVGKS